MAWGLGDVLTSLIGKENVDAVRNAYNNSSFKNTVDNTATGLGDAATFVGNKYGQFQDTSAANRAAREQEQYAANKARLEMANAVPAYLQDDSITDVSLGFIPPTKLATGTLAATGKPAAKKVAEASTKAGAPKHPSLVKRDLQAVRDMRVPDNSMAAAIAKNEQDLVRQQIQFDELARSQAMKNASNTFVAKQAIAAENAAHRAAAGTAWKDNYVENLVRKELLNRNQGLNGLF